MSIKETSWDHFHSHSVSYIKDVGAIPIPGGFLALCLIWNINLPQQLLVVDQDQLVKEEWLVIIIDVLQ